MDYPWFQDAIFYAVDVARFADSDGDGFGDFKGLLGKLDYLQDLGVTALWLLPFYPSPRRDNGYDVTDYYRVDPRLGTLADFEAVVRAAGERGMRVLIDLVMNHTSDEHPWFEAARRDSGSRFRKYYTWSELPPPSPADQGPIVGDHGRVWTFDELAGQYYFHRFYPFQPDLDFDNPDVMDEAHRFMDYWLSYGVAGFRLDAIPILAGSAGPPDGEPRRARDPRPILKRVREGVEGRRKDVALLGEADVEAERLDDYFAGGEGLNLLFNFLLNNYLWLALARGDVEPLHRVLGELPSTPPNCFWANFIRNLDELDLERLDEDERQEVFEAFAPKKSMQIYGRGARRRFAPMLSGDRRRMELVMALTLSLPGAPVIVYGDEIGMGEDLTQADRATVRLPMQWDGGRNGGFSKAPAAKLVQRPVATGKFGYRRINAASQQGDEGSYWWFVRRLLHARREHPEFSRGAWHIISTGSDAVFGMRTAYEDMSVLTLHNLSGRKQKVRLDLRAQRGRRLRSILGDHDDLPIGDELISIELAAFGYRWYRVAGDRNG